MFDVFPKIVEDIFITIFPGFFLGFTKQRENSAVFLDESRGTPCPQGLLFNRRRFFGSGWVR
jgi:hypothetical protein